MTPILLICKSCVTRPVTMECRQADSSRTCLPPENQIGGPPQGTETACTLRRLGPPGSQPNTRLIIPISRITRGP